MDFLIVDGKVISEDEIELHSFLQENTFQLAEKIWFGYGGIPFFKENIELLQHQMQLLQLEVPEELKNTRELFRITKRMLNKNKLYRSGLIRIELSWKNDRPTTLITSHPSTEFEFPFQEQGILLHFSNHRKFSKDSFNPYSFYNQPRWKIAERELKNTSFKDTIFLNENDTVCECLKKNIYILKSNMLITPSKDTGCYVDVARSSILEIAENSGIQVTQTEDIKTEDILQADELFTVSEEYAFQWILGVEQKRFVRNLSNEVYDKFVNFLKEKAH